MHDTAALTGAAFFKHYAKAGDRILDVGSMYINGSLRAVAPLDSEYVGLDISNGPGVDVILQHPGDDFPFEAASFDLVVSTSSLEHDAMFWCTFAQMARVVKPGGLVYVSVPSNGPYHGYPGDCWRFYKDAAPALATWATMCGHEVELIETFMVAPMSDVWIDNVMIFSKPPVFPIVRRVKLSMRLQNRA